MAISDAILAIDQGTTSSRAIIFDKDATIIAVAQEEFPQIYPDDGWVEHDPEAIWSSTVNVCKQAIADAQSKGATIVAAGITNQRETTIVWDRETHAPIGNAIVWQDRRTADICRGLESKISAEDLQTKTGLRLDPYFSATKIAWLLDNAPDARDRAERGKLAFGTVDSFLVWRLTKGKIHATDATNASRTNLYNIVDGTWDDDLLALFNVPKSVLPSVKDSSDLYGVIDASLFGLEIPILGVAGDQQAATFGQACFGNGDIKSTYGTGCFVVQNTGDTPVFSKNQLLTTIAYQIDGKPTYGLEGSIFVAGAAIQWLRDGIGVIESARDTEEMAKNADPNSHVYLVPAFTGLGAPQWDPDARAAIYGLTRAASPNDLARAAIEAVCYQTHDLLAAMTDDGAQANVLKVDGGMVANDWMCDFLSSILSIPVDRPKVMETTALGVAYLAGLKAGIYRSMDEIAAQWNLEKRFETNMMPDVRSKRLDGWSRAVQATVAFKE